MNSNLPDRVTLIVWRVWVALICTVFLGPLIGTFLGVAGYTAVGTALFLLAAACAAIALLVLILGTFAMIMHTFIHGPPRLSPYSGWWAWRWYRHHHWF